MSSNKFSFHCDVVVVGGGLAALSAAISAGDNGAIVLLVNKGISESTKSKNKSLRHWSRPNT